MATTSYAVNNALAVKLWSKKLFVDSLKATYASKFMGKSSSSLIQILEDTQKGAGDQITFGLRMQLSGAGVAGDGTLEGNEEALTTYSDAVIINQLRHAVRSSGKMSEQRVPFSVREEARQGLQDWWADRIDTWFFNQIAGNTAQTDTKYTGLQAAVAPDDSHHIVCETGSTTDDQLDSNDLFGLSWIDAAVVKAKTLTNSIRPLKVGGEDKYVMFLHPYQVRDMRTSTSTGQWLDIQKAAMQGGNVENNPIFTGALGEYNGVILHESTRVPLGVDASNVAVANTRRAVLCGAQAAAMAFGQDGGPNKMSWVEEMFDYENQLGVSAGMIAGLKKVRFNSLDFGTIVVSSYAAA